MIQNGSVPETRIQETSMPEEGVTVFAESRDIEERWIGAMKSALGSEAEGVRMEASGSGSVSRSLVFVDARMRDLAETLLGLDRRSRSVFLIANEGDEIAPEVMALADDVIVSPFRKLELLGKMRLHHQLRMWSEVNELNVSFQGLLSSIDEDVRLAERLQKAKLPVRFPETRGLQVRSRYLAGMRSGGDHFDLAESRDGSRVSLILSDSSSYGLSSALLSTLMRVTMKLSQDELRSCAETVRLIHEELELTLKEKDRLSLFYGVLSRKDYILRYTHLGGSGVFHAPKGQSFRRIDAQGAALMRDQARTSIPEGELRLSASDRLVLVSDGFMEACGGHVETCRLLDTLREKESLDTLNEFTFRVKRGLVDPEEDLPEQDCSAMVIDIDAKVLKLA